MNRWLKIEFDSDLKAKALLENINICILSNPGKQYFKVFTFKQKDLKFKAFFIADEGSPAITCLEKKYPLKEAKPPVRSLITRIAGFSADREWMFK